MTSWAEQSRSVAPKRLPGRGKSRGTQDLARTRSRALPGAAGGSRRHGRYGRFPSGATATDRRQKFALSPGNTARFESPISLARGQLLLEGKVGQAALLFVFRRSEMPVPRVGLGAY